MDAEKEKEIAELMSIRDKVKKDREAETKAVWFGFFLIMALNAGRTSA